uniref:Boundary element associated factor n=2 Tax=Drosophila melanogaster TaxID=7227 RepID=Q7JN06_DROME|eukprot:NP_523747.1 boundary element-associated factor of 32kD, isoform A [Drosophila melanogaster]
MHVEKKSELRSLLKSGDKRCKLVEPRNTKSCVWRFFNLVQCDDHIEPYACCKTCGDLLSYSGKTGTGSLLRHRCLHSSSSNDKTVRITKAKTLREPLRVAKPKIESNVANYLGEAGALPQKWEEYEQNDEISEDIKDIIYSEDPLCYSPIHVMDDEGLDQPEKQVTVLTHSTSPAGGSSRPIGVGSGVQATVVASTSSSSSSAKQLKNNLETSIERLTAVSEQLSYIIQQNHEELTKDDDYYFALSLVPAMRHLSLSRKMYVRSKIQDILFKESEDSTLAKDE